MHLVNYPYYARSPFTPCGSWGLWPSCELRPTLVGDAFPESVLTVLLGVEDRALVASLRFVGLGLVLKQPGATFEEAGLTLTGAALMGGLEQMEGWGTDFSSVAQADFNSGCKVKSDKGGRKNAISVDS